uniref:14-3-3 domain-containing protein n=1 Tax=Corethron hystrix TaxID=216773 RepID=A0A7S1B581_9STRA|mmetsp:Transcript_12626/g.27909  ORF Transcript_12626/g.27909 Transcript_12626/m.27909 type:complete len:170 (+) Transcript_12626:178-687(+)
MQRNHAMFMATLSARANRFDEMIAYLKKVIQHPVELNREEMQIVAFGCKNAIDGRRDSIAGITKYESLLKIEWKNKEVDHFCTNEVDKTKTVALQKYKEEIANELTVICHQVIELVDECRQNSRSRENITNYYQVGYTALMVECYLFPCFGTNLSNLNFCFFTDKRRLF